MGGVGAGTGPSGGMPGSDAGNWSGGSSQSSGNIGSGDSPSGYGGYEGAMFGNQASNPPGALSGLGGLTFSSAVPALLGAGLPIVGGLLAGFPGALAGSVIGSIFTGDFGKGLGNIPGQIVSHGLSAATKGAGYGIPGMIASSLINGMISGGRGGGESPGDTSDVGFGGPDAIAMANAMMSGGVDQGMVPGVGALAPAAQSVQAGPVGQPSPVAMQPNYFGMKRVNMPWAAWPASRTQYSGGNYGGMKRV